MVELEFINACRLRDWDMINYIHTNFEINDYIINLCFCNSCRYNNYEIIDWLLYNYDIDINCSAFKLACMNGNLDIVEWLYNQLIPNIENKYLENGLIHACKNGYMEAAKILIKHHPELIKYDVNKFIQLTNNSEILDLLKKN